jgi:hypothetical protein
LVADCHFECCGIVQSPDLRVIAQAEGLGEAGAAIANTIGNMVAEGIRSSQDGLVTDLCRSPERFKLGTGGRRDDEAFRGFQARGWQARSHAGGMASTNTRIALTSGLARERVAADLGIGKSTLGKWISHYRPTDLVAEP